MGADHHKTPVCLRNVPQNKIYSKHNQKIASGPCGYRLPRDLARKEPWVRHLHSYSRTACLPAGGAKDTFISKHRDSINISPCHSQGASGFAFANNSREQNVTLEWRMHWPNGIIQRKYKARSSLHWEVQLAQVLVFIWNLKMAPPNNDSETASTLASTV